MTCVVDRDDADVRAAAKFESVNSAVRCDQPGRVFCPAMNGSEQVQCQVADRSCVRVDRDAFVLVIAEYLVEFRRRTP